MNKQTTNKFIYQVIRQFSRKKSLEPVYTSFIKFPELVTKSEFGTILTH